MSLTVCKPVTPVILGPPAYVLDPDHGPDWVRVEKVASRFHLPSHRRAVRVYLYATLRDVEALRRWADDLMRKKKLPRAVARGQRLLAEAREKYPEVFAELMEEFSREAPRPNRYLAPNVPKARRRRH